ncbi:hypothetical protein [Streptomyces sp. SID3212]|uniref:hypothetical protein n=1 Tax=Streptomyces sp. SID3212 TaxID=2690259 RepID=UPI00136E2F12|nr:hypothetical protein [Streptomyces sp. SID3212]MYV55151.1 hypothetical protein [Streptomyces sp. SID3212]
MSPPLRLLLGLEEHFPAAGLETRRTGGPASLVLSLTPLPLPWHRASIAGPPRQGNPRPGNPRPGGMTI